MPRGFSIIGLLITMACIVVLFAIFMTSVNKAVTGEGSTKQNTVYSMQDQILLSSLYQALFVYGGDNDEWYPIPSDIDGSGDGSRNTTAAMYSAMIAQNYIQPQSLFSKNEQSVYVEPCTNYDYLAYNPQRGVYWDPHFKADLNELSHTSFAHQPLFGERMDRWWGITLQGHTPIVGNRGPKDGVADIDSYTYGRNGAWAGHVLLSDGSVRFVETFTPSDIYYERNGERRADNIFAIDDGVDGVDAVLSFTSKMTPEGPVLQHD